MLMLINTKNPQNTSFEAAPSNRTGNLTLVPGGAQTDVLA